jgi:ornithine cyclodeaminase
MNLEVVGADELARVLTPADALSALERAFSQPPADLPERQHLEVGCGELLLMPAWSVAGVGVKLITVAPENPDRGLPLIHGLYVLFDRPGLRPIALFDAAPLTALRTAAVSALATKHLARADSRHLLIFGAGVQARAHLVAMHDLLALESVCVVSRTQTQGKAMVEEGRSLGLDVKLGVPADVAKADVVCTCTTSTQPLFDGALLSPGTHLNAVGSYRPGARELDDRTIQRAVVVVDTRAALASSGDLIGPLSSGALAEKDVRTLDQVLDGSGRRATEDVTVFKSVGAASQDLAVAQAAAERL